MEIESCQFRGAWEKDTEKFYSLVNRNIKRFKKNEQNPRNLQDNIIQVNICGLELQKKNQYNEVMKYF